jgi:hypothetical protein
MTFGQIDRKNRVRVSSKKVPAIEYIPLPTDCPNLRQAGFPTKVKPMRNVCCCDMDSYQIQNNHIFH